jgi:hypothetical protein
MKKPMGFDEAPSYTGEYEQPTLGGHVCVIKGARTERDAKGIERLIIQFDFAQEDQQAGFFMRQYERMKQLNPSTAKWPNGGVYRQGTEGKSVPYFKGLITVIENSNEGFQWGWDEQALKGQLFGGVFGREEFYGQDGRVHWAVKCVRVCSLDRLQNAEIPPDKTVDGQPSNSMDTQMRGMGGYQIDDDTLPF